MTDPSSSSLAPLRLGAFRILWTVALMANIAMWMNDVAAAWMMSTLTTAPLWVGLVQTAAMLPVFLLGLPSGALADMLDRKRLLVGTQLGAAATAAVLSAAAFLDGLTPALLLLLTFVNGVGLALRMPVLSVVLPEAVPHPQWPAAMALGAVSVNASRIIGPLVAGIMIAQVGAAWVFLLNAVLSLVALVVLLLWKREARHDPLGPESLGTAMRAGLKYVGHSRHLKGVLLRMVVFFLCTAALMAMLPLLARGLQDSGARVFTLLVAAMGAGAIAATSVLPRMRRRYRWDALVMRGTLVQAASMLGMAWVTSPWQALPLMFVAGGAWLLTGNTLLVSSQMELPSWVRARGISISQVVMMGASAAGAAVWGQTATLTSVPTSLTLAALLMVSCMAAVNRLVPGAGATQDLTLQPVDGRPLTCAPPTQGQVMMSVEYRVHRDSIEEFKALMLGEVRSSRMRHGAVSWELLRDLNDPCRFQETIVDRSWTEHLRHFERMTTSDLALRDRRLAFHQSPDMPVVQRFLMTSTVVAGQAKAC